MTMKFNHQIFCFLVGLFAALMGGCGEQDRNSGHVNHEESFVGATFKAGKGVMVSDKTRQILDLTLVDVTEKHTPYIIPLNVQIFGETHRFSHIDMHHTGCDIHGSGFLSPDHAARLEPRQIVKVATPDGQSLEGFVISTQNNLAQGEIEVLIGIPHASDKLKEGDFVAATIIIPRKNPVITIPRSALLSTIENTYVYTVNGDAFYRTLVQVGNETENEVEIVDGLFVGDQIVTKPVETLWLIELRATKGGAHCH